MNRYYQVSNFQLFIMALLIGIIAGALIIINIRVSEYLQLPMVTMSSDGKCAAVANYRNGEAFTCNDVGTVLRSYRVKKN